MAHSHSDLDYTGVRLRLVGTRVSDASKEKHGGDGHEHDDTETLLPGSAMRDAPIFEKNEAATNFELFYDLWFVANLNVFASVHDISGDNELVSFIGYITLLWTTWLMTTIYDVRFTSDSVLERCCKAIHLGVMIGFAEIGTSFNPDKQISSVFKAMSLFLMMSRLTLALQYGVVLWQIRKYVDGRRQVLTTALLHLSAALVYLGISFRYEVGKNSRVFVVWYIVGVLEMAVHLGFSQLSSVLSFIGTHLGERLNLLTLIILGEGVIILAKNVTLLVKDTYVKDNNLAMWSPSLIGIVTSSTALIYIVFQLYYDWMHEDLEESMYVRHQVWWAALHLPFHIVLVLMLEGSGQFIVWARILESTEAAVNKLVGVSKKLPDEPKSADVVKVLSDVIYPFMRKYQPAEVLETWASVNETMHSIGDIPDEFWVTETAEDDPDFILWVNDLYELLTTMVNCIYNSFGIEVPDESNKGSSGPFGEVERAQSETYEAIGKRFRLVFIYAFACSGIVLLFLTIFHLLSKRKGWSIFNMIRTGICLCLSLGLALVPLLVKNEQATETFMGTPWMLPVITISYFVALVISHLPHPSWGGLSKLRKGRYRHVEENKGFNESHQLRPLSSTAGPVLYGDGYQHSSMTPGFSPKGFGEHQVRPLSSEVSPMGYGEVQHHRSISTEYTPSGYGEHPQPRPGYGDAQKHMSVSSDVGLSGYGESQKHMSISSDVSTLAYQRPVDESDYGLSSRRMGGV